MSFLTSAIPVFPVTLVVHLLSQPSNTLFIALSNPPNGYLNQALYYWVIDGLHDTHIHMTHLYVEVFFPVKYKPCYIGFVLAFRRQSTGGHQGAEEACHPHWLPSRPEAAGSQV